MLPLDLPVPCFPTQRPDRGLTAEEYRWKLSREWGEET
jgi:hypothetical protein